MCGILGIKNYNSNIDINKVSSDIIKSLINRGPDYQNYWINKDRRTAFYHTRLSILDTSNNGNQPMFSKNKRFLMIYNGEVYNFNEIKQKLLIKGIKFKGSSDTEVILESISTLGFSKTISILEGMFSLGVYDLENDKIYLARDRVGIKPLYWCKNQELFIFGSDLKAFKKSKQLNLSINNSLINSFLKYGYIPSPYTIYENVFKLDPGNILEYDSNGNIKIYNYIPNFHNEKKNIQLF